MTTRIRRDAARFHEIVRGRIRQNLRKYVTHGEMIGRQGGDYVSIPVPQLDVPHFRFGKNKSHGVGRGEGQPGQPVGRGGDESGEGMAGSDPGQHILEVDVTLDELADMLGQELKLPRIQPKGRQNLDENRARYDSIRRTGPESLRHFKRSFVQALRRQIATGTYDWRKPRVIPVREDMRYRSWSQTKEPQASAVVIYLMDVSGSMTDQQKKIVRTTAFWIDTWLRRQYKGLERRYIIHDAVAKVVDEETFYHTRESGGTRISSAYRVGYDLIVREFPPSEWNIYVFQFSDGDNWGEDNKESLRMLAEQILPACNLFCYGQVESPYGSGDYLQSLKARFGTQHPLLVLGEIDDENGIYDAIKLFLGTGK